MTLAWTLAALATVLAAALALRVRAQSRVLAGQRAQALGDIERAHRAAVADERNRIYDDLHDDLGAGLLRLVYEAPTPAYADLARGVLQDLRDVVTRSRGTPGTLEQVLAGIRAEATQRLQAIGSSLRWEQPEQLPALVLPIADALHLFRIVREAISNALRHAAARRLRVRVRLVDRMLELELTDDGSDGPPVADAGGRGMRSMQQRAGELHGQIGWTRGTEGGTKVLLSVPLATERD